MDALFDLDAYTPPPTFDNRYLTTPATTLDTRAGTWATLKERWTALELGSTAGRSEGLTYQAADTEVGRMIQGIGTTSEFDPVLCETIYRWWTPEDGVILDPYAGGCTRGIVASILGRTYHGVDLSPTQVDANVLTAHRLAQHLGPPPRWYENDSSHWQPNVAADAIVSCPPYGALERYSDDPRDHSTLKWHDFAGPYRATIAAAAARLRPNRFAIFVVGNYREGEALRDLAGLTIAAYEDAGLHYYSDTTLINAVGTARVRISGVFNKNRKVSMLHQNVLVFVKGDPIAAAAACDAGPAATGPKVASA